jgi:predicted GNAT superfamily acetyltransferase
MAFHQKMGFEEIGTNDFEKNSVVYLRRPFSR